MAKESCRPPLNDRDWDLVVSENHGRHHEGGLDVSRVGAFCVNSIESSQPFRDTHHTSPTGPVEDLAWRLNGDSGNMCFASRDLVHHHLPSPFCRSDELNQAECSGFARVGDD